MKNIVVTGASGFIGRYVVKALLSKGYIVTSLSRNNHTQNTNNQNHIMVTTDYSQALLTKQLRSCDALIHLAGRRLSREDTPGMSAPFVCDASKILDNLLYACKENSITRVITTSSIGVYSDANSVPYTESEAAKPATLYGLSKLFSEQRADFYSRQYKGSVAHVRLAQCYGYGEKPTPAIMHFIEKALKKETIVLNDGGQYPIDEIYIEDAVRAFIKLVESDLEGPFNIGSGRSYTILEIAQTVNKVFGNEDNIEIRPQENAFKEKHLDIAKAKTLLGWQPEFTLYDGLKDMKQYIHKAKRI